MLIDKNGKATVEAHLTNAAFQSHLQEILAQIKKDEGHHADEEDGDDNETKDSAGFKDDSSEPQDAEQMRQKGDMAMYRFYLQSFRKSFLILFAILTVFASFTEYFPGKQVPAL